jgi:5-oxoprolinase (ATP-hydrolysing)
MEYAVRHQHEQYEGNLKPGDHILTNHPLAGGTHLPDITIITPVWDHNGKKVVFYVASRGHHGETQAPSAAFFDFMLILPM